MRQQLPVILVTRVIKYFDTEEDKKKEENYEYGKLLKTINLEHVSSSEEFLDFDDYETECCIITFKDGTEFIIEGNVEDFYKLLKNYYKSKNLFIFANNN